MTNSTLSFRWLMQQLRRPSAPYRLHTKLTRLALVAWTFYGVLVVFAESPFNPTTLGMAYGAWTVILGVLLMGYHRISHERARRARIWQLERKLKRKRELGAMYQNHCAHLEHELIKARAAFQVISQAFDGRGAVIEVDRMGILARVRHEVRQPIEGEAREIAS